MEILQFKKLRDSQVWNIIKSTLVVIGTLSSFVALQTGEMAEGIAGRSRLVETHSTIATIAVWFFVVVAIIHLVHIVNTEFAQAKDWCWNTRYVRSVWSIVSRISDFIFKYWWILILVGIIGLVLISIVGALGGAIVYGPDADPAVSLIYHLFF
jgi:hypothetical protein